VRSTSKRTIHAVICKDAESDQWVAHCLEYDVATQGSSEEHAIAMIKEAVELHLEDRDPADEYLFYQPIEGKVSVHEVAVDAPTLLHSRAEAIGGGVARGAVSSATSP